MTPQEKDLINSLLSRLQQQAPANPPKDAEAEALIGQGMAAIPDAPYLLVQTVLIQDMALNEAHRRLTELEGQLAGKAATPAAPSSFLGAALKGSVPAAGPWGQAAPQTQPPPSPIWTQSGGSAPGAYPGQSYPPQPMMAPLAAPGASGGFLRQAATTAAGVAGGALLFQGIQSLFGPHLGGNVLGGMPMQPGIGETVVNNYYNTPDQSAADVTPADQSYDPNDCNDPGLVQADDSPDFGNDAGGDFGGGDGGSFDV